MADGAMLQFQNKKLSAQLAQTRREVGDLEKKLEDAKKEQEGYEDTLLAVNRVWKQLNEDVRFMASSVGISAADCGEDVKPDLSKAADPFLEKLLGKGAVKQEATALGGDSQVEAALAARSAATGAAMTAVISAIQAEQKRCDDLTKQLGSASSDAALKAEAERATKELEALRSEARQAAGARRVAEEAAALQEDRALKAQAMVRKLETELGDLQADLDTAHRKIAELKEQVKSGGGGGIPTTPLTPGANPTTPASVAKGRGGGASSEELEKLGMEAKEWAAERLELKSMLLKRDKEVEDALEEKLKLQSQLAAAAGGDQSGGDEAAVLKSRAYIMLGHQLEAARKDAAAAREHADAIARTQDGAQLLQLKLMTCEQALEFHKKELRGAGARCEQVERKCAELAQQASEAVLQVQAAESKAGPQDTVGELKLMVSTLQKEVQMLQSKDAKRKGEAAAVEKYRLEARAAHIKAEGGAAAVERLKARCAAAVADAARLEGEVAAAGRREKELQLFVEVLQEGCALERPPAQQQAAERRLQEEVEALKAQLGGHELAAKVAAAEGAAKKARAKIEALEGEVDAAKLEAAAAAKEVEDLKAAISSKSAEGSAYIEEIEEIGRAYEDMQAQNTRILQDITERDETISGLVAERIKATLAQKAAEDAAAEAGLGVQQVVHERDIGRERLGQLERQVEDLITQLGRATEDAREKGRILEVQKRAAATAAQSAHEAAGALEAERAARADKRKREDGAAADLERERLKRRRQEEESSQLEAKLERMEKALTSGSASEALAQEVKAYKNIIKCSVCHSRDKEVAITKCFHLFCKPCIDKNLETRHRKCPGCGVQFGAADVKKIYLQ